MLKKYLAFFLFVVLVISATAQINYGGEPMNWADKHLPAFVIFETIAQPDLALLQAEDAVTDQYKEVPYRFGMEYAVNYTFNNSGVWTEYPALNRKVWHLGISGENAKSLNLLFSDFSLPKGSALYIWNADRTQFIGKFDHRSNNENNLFPTSLIYGDACVIEYSVPLNATNLGQFTISQVVYGYREIVRSHFVEADEDRGPFGSSGNCNININCPEGADWQTDKRSVALIVQGGSALCTGALVNNTTQDGTPYFLTANHCLGGNVGSWVFYFNHESSSCSGNTGPTNQSISGSVLRASNAASDVALLELNDVPPTSFNVLYAGWDNSDLPANAMGCVGIHHPSGDVKKICFEEDTPTQTTQFGAQVWYINQWELGVTEGGSSGSPLFNMNHQIIGQLYGGYAACSGSVNNGQADWYGRFGVSWDNGNSASSRLKDWLDPGNSGAASLNSYPDGFVAAALDAGAQAIAGIATTVCGSSISPSVTIRNYGSTTLTSCTIHWTLNGGAEQTQGWTGSLAQNVTAVVNLPQMTASNGSNTLNVWVTNPNGATDENSNNNNTTLQFNAIVGDVFNHTVNITLDDYPDETSWEITQNANTLWSSNGTYGNESGGAVISVEVCLAEGCYDFTILDEWGDGICCVYGNGSYEVLNQNQVVVASGGAFADSETTEICISANNIQIIKSSALISAFPNPTEGSIRLEGMTSKGQIRWVDASGKVIQVSTIQEKSQEMDLSELAPGLYTVVIVLDNGYSQSLSIVKK